jgi:hypothetical protein
MDTAKRSARTLLRRAGLDVRRARPAGDGPDGDGPRAIYRRHSEAIIDRHEQQTEADVEGLRARYEQPLLGTVEVWSLVEQLAQCIDPTDCRLYCTSQQTHVRQILEGMEHDGVDDPDLLLTALIHDLGKVLMLAGEDPANVVCLNTPIGHHEPGVGLDQVTFQWNHDEFGWSRFRDHVPDHVAWLIRYHSIEPDDCVDLMDDRDRDYTERYLRVFSRYDHGTKSPFHLPRRPISDYRDLVEDAFPHPIEF